MSVARKVSEILSVKEWRDLVCVIENDTIRTASYSLSIVS